MSIRDYLSDEQIEKIKSVIKTQCENAARNDAVERNRIPTELYDKLKKGRKAHDVTGDIYVSLFYPENTIEGLSIELSINGIYTQPELVNDDAPGTQAENEPVLEPGISDDGGMPADPDAVESIPIPQNETGLEFATVKNILDTYGLGTSEIVTAPDGTSYWDSENETTSCSVRMDSNQKIYDASFAAKENETGIYYLSDVYKSFSGLDDGWIANNVGQDISVTYNGYIIGMNKMDDNLILRVTSESFNATVGAPQ